MNLPNKITILRMILVIPFILILSFAITSVNQISYKSFNISTLLFIVAAIIFIIAMITDYLDGYLARKNNQVTTFGKLFDPLADKIITTSALIVLSIAKIIPFYITLIFILRDVLVDGSRNLAAKNNLKVAASIWGKAKTMVMTIAIIIIFFIYPLIENFTNKFAFKIVLNIPLIIGALLSLISGYKYFIIIIPLLKVK